MNVATVTIQYIVKSDVDCLYIDTDYWAMDLSWLDDGQYINSTIDIVSKNRGLGPVYAQHAIRPVINLKKCAIDNTCE